MSEQDKYYYKHRNGAHWHAVQIIPFAKAIVHVTRLAHQCVQYIIASNKGDGVINFFDNYAT